MVTSKPLHSLSITGHHAVDVVIVILVVGVVFTIWLAVFILKKNKRD